MGNAEKGSLIVSTKSNAAANKTVQIAACGLLGIIVIIAIANFDGIFSSMGRDMFGSASTGKAIGGVCVVAMLCYIAFNLITTFLGSKSFCDVYEGGVVGKTALSANQPNTPMQDFDISYTEIANVTEAGKTIIIYTKYAKYEVLALKNRTEAVQEIRQRISKAD